MATSPHETILRERAGQLADVLAACGIAATVNESSWRDYHVKLDLVAQGEKAGRISLYYAPSKQTFSLVTSEVTSVATIETVKREFQKVERQPAKPPKPTTIATPVPKGWVAYVDGTYMHGHIGYGAVILRDGEQQHELLGRVTENHESRQVAGELLATMKVVEWCEQQGIPDITIVYDYAGIEMWAKKRWKANLPLTQDYVAFFERTSIKVRFKKVQSHSGDKWNDVADQLARKGAGEKG